jgi:hypothetical protein
MIKYCYVIQAIKDQSKIEALKKDALKAISPYYKDNELKLDYHIAKVTKKK